MSTIFITGSSQGLGLLAAEGLIAQGHQVTLHARNEQIAKQLRETHPDASHIVVGDLSSQAQVLDLAKQVNEIGRFDSIIQNAGICYSESHQLTENGIQSIFAVNVVAPYLLASLLERPERMIFLSSSMHRGVHHNDDDLNWDSRRWNSTMAYSESKLYVTALCCYLARVWPETRCNSVDPGWVPTRMGGSSAPDDLQKGWQTQSWLAVSNDLAAQVSGYYFHHQQQHQPDPLVHNHQLQQTLIHYCKALTGVSLKI